jgi:hypothetical protein
MTSRQRIVSAWNGEPYDYVPLTTGCFGFPAPPNLGWQRDGKKVKYWYSKRMEYIHTLPQPWELEDDFKRVLAWQSIGIDDILELSVPWGMNPEVTWQDSRIEKPRGEAGSILVRSYETPSGLLRHAVRKTEDIQEDGWVIQPDYVPLIDDFNIPRAVEHLISSPEDIPKLAHVYAPPDDIQRHRFHKTVEKVREFAEIHGIPIQAWSAFGMDGVIWFAGIEGSILMAMDHPKAFDQLMETVHQTDFARAELAASIPCIDMIIHRGWYSTTDFWSPGQFDEYVSPRISELAELAHDHGKKFCYVMTTGLETLGTRLARAGVDVLYFVDPLDPVEGGISLSRMKKRLSDRLTMVGGISSLTLASRNTRSIEAAVCSALEILGPTNRFVLHPADALFPDTPWESVELLINTWKKYR